MNNKIRILYTIPNFDTAGSGIPLLKIANNLDNKYFEPQIACLHERGDLFQEVIKSGINRRASTTIVCSQGKNNFVIPIVSAFISKKILSLFLINFPVATPTLNPD